MSLRSRSDNITQHLGHVVIVRSALQPQRAGSGIRQIPEAPLTPYRVQTRVADKEQLEERRPFIKRYCEPLESYPLLSHAEVKERDRCSRTVFRDAAALQLFLMDSAASQSPSRTREVAESGKRPVTPLRHLHGSLEVAVRLIGSSLLLECQSTEPSSRPKNRIQPDQVIAKFRRGAEITHQEVQGRQLHADHGGQWIQ